ncbi:hypothetical protein ACROYT_G038898 [Oculina patagonica]
MRGRPERRPKRQSHDNIASDCSLLIEDRGRIKRCQLLHHMPRSIQGHRVTNRDISRVHLQLQMLLVQDTCQITRVGRHRNTNPFQYNQCQQRMFMLEGSVRLATEKHFKTSSLFWAFA